MSHLIYSTEAVVLKAEDRGEASKLFWLFTERFGLVVAHAQSVRAGHSKLKHELQLYNLAKVSLVRGREYWRIVNVTASDQVRSSIATEKKFLAEASDFLLRLIHGEGEHKDIFADLLQADREILYFKARVLADLGYLPLAWLSQSNRHKSELLTAIDQALMQSQL